MRLGVDFGTTNSSIAFFDGNELFSMRLDPLNDNHFVLPSLVYIDRNHEPTVGTKAGEEYLLRETGRQVKWEERHVGEIEYWVAGRGGSPIHYFQDAHAMVDTAANGRLLQSIKTALRSERYDGTEIFDRFYTIDELISIILHSLRVSAETQLGQDCRCVVIGRPVRFSDDPEITARAEEILFKAARFAGFDDIEFQLEPIGAAYLHHRSSRRRETALVFDFGGGTLDLTIAEVGGKLESKILSTRGVLIGGDDLDRRIMQILLKYFGAGAKMKSGEPFPSFILGMLGGWQTMPDLSRPRYRRLIKNLQETCSNPEALYALETLVTQNIGFKLFQEIERAKKRLSRETATRFDFAYDNIEIHEVITRQQFEEAISKEVEQVEEGVLQVVNAAGIKPSQVDIVLRTGGTSLVPVFIRLLAKLFGEEKLREMDPLTSVVGGLAVAAHVGDGQKPSYAARYATPTKPLIKDIQVASGELYKQYVTRVDAKCYVDRSYIIKRIPVVLSGLPAVRTANSDKEASSERLLQFHLDNPSRIYVAYEAAATGIPTWLRSFTREIPQIEIEEPVSEIERVLQVYSKDFPPGAIVLGGNHADGFDGDVNTNYLVIVEIQA